MPLNESEYLKAITILGKHRYAYTINEIIFETRKKAEDYKKKFNLTESISTVIIY